MGGKFLLLISLWNVFFWEVNYLENFLSFFLYWFFLVLGDFLFLLGGVFNFCIGDLCIGVVGLLFGVFGFFFFLGDEVNIGCFFLGMIVFIIEILEGVWGFEVMIFNVFSFCFLFFNIVCILCYFLLRFDRCVFLCGLVFFEDFLFKKLWREFWIIEWFCRNCW